MKEYSAEFKERKRCNMKKGIEKEDKNERMDVRRMRL